MRVSQRTSAIYGTQIKRVDIIVAGTYDTAKCPSATHSGARLKYSWYALHRGCSSPPTEAKLCISHFRLNQSLDHPERFLTDVEIGADDSDAMR